MPAPDLLAVQVRVHLTFFRRNRLLLAATAVFLLIIGISLVQDFLWRTSGGRFQTLCGFNAQLNDMIRFCIPGLGMLFLWSHLRERTVKMVVSKPCPPETWLASGLLAAALISAALHLLALLVTWVLSLAWGLTFQTGFAFVAVESFLGSLIALAYLSLITLVMHPVLALLTLSLLNEETVYGFKYLLAVSVQAHPGNRLYGLLGHLCDGIYALIPTFHPFQARFQDVARSYRTNPEEWLYLGASAGYALLAAVVFFLLAVVVLRRKALS